MKRMSRWRRVATGPLDTLVAKLGRGLEGDADALHAARVASRRSRALVAILRPALRRRRSRKLLAGLRRITSLLGHVRELDVSLRLLEDSVGADPRVGPNRGERVPRVRDLRMQLLSERQEALAAASRKALPETAGKVRGWLSAKLEQLDEQKWDWNRAAANELERRARRLVAAVDRAQVAYDADRLHRARVALKHFRYVVELASEGRGKAAKRQLAVLRYAQDLLGRMHDVDVLTRRLRAVTDAHAAAVRSALEAEARNLHAQYLSSRPRLIRVISECRQRFGEPARPFRRRRVSRAEQKRGTETAARD